MQALHAFQRRKLVLAIPAMLACASASADQAFPSRLIRFIVPFSAGASPDVMARLVAEDLSKRLGQTVIIENKPGVGGNLGADYVVKQAPDGYTVLVGSTANLAVNKTLYKQLPYDPEKDFVPLSIAWMTRNVLIVPNGSEFRSIKDLVDAAKRQPERLSFGSPGNGTAGHLIGVKFQSSTKTALTHVPYKGQNQVVTDLMGNHLQLSFETIGSALPLIEAGKVRALAITGTKRHPKLPEVPTFGESGVADLDQMRGWAMFAVPAQTPAVVVKKLQDGIAASLSSPAVRQKLEELGVEVNVTSPEASRNYIREEVQRWGALVRATGVRTD